MVARQLQKWGTRCEARPFISNQRSHCEQQGMRVRTRAPRIRSAQGKARPACRGASTACEASVAAAPREPRPPLPVRGTTGHAQPRSLCGRGAGPSADVGRSAWLPLLVGYGLGQGDTLRPGHLPVQGGWMLTVQQKHGGAVWGGWPAFALAPRRAARETRETVDDCSMVMLDVGDTEAGYHDHSGSTHPSVKSGGGR